MDKWKKGSDLFSKVNIACSMISESYHGLEVCILLDSQDFGTYTVQTPYQETS